MTSLPRRTPRALYCGLATSLALLGCSPRSVPAEQAETFLVAASGNGQNAPVGATLPGPLVVKATNAAGGPLAGVEVTWAPALGGGRVVSSVGVTGNDGLAQATVGLGSATGTNSFTASASGLTGSPVTFTATATLGSSTSTSTSTPSRVAALGALTLSALAGSQVPLAVRVTNGNGDPLADVFVSWTLSGAAGGGLSPQNSLTGADGVARTTSTFPLQAGTINVSAKVGSLAAVTFKLTALPGPAARLVPVTPNGQSVVVGLSLTLTARVVDDNGNAVSGTPVGWAPGTIGGGVAPTSSLSGPDGAASTLATFGGLVGTSTFTATAAGLAGSPLTFSFLLQGIPAIRVVEIGAKVAAGALGDTNGDGTTNSSADEFVELLNIDSATADLSGWTLRTGSSTSTLRDRFTFPAGAQLAPGARAVVFGGGTPAGDFGGALVYVATSSLSLTDGGAWVELQVVPGLDAEPPFLYPAAPSNGASLQRDPEAGGPFVAHTGPAGSPGLLWSPGSAPTGTRLRVNPGLSSPAPGAIGVDPRSPLTVQLNTGVLLSSVAAGLHVYASSCASSTGEVAGAATTTNSGSAVLFSPASYLAAATLHCVRATTALRTDARDGAGSPVGQNLPANAQWEFTTLDLSDLVRPTVVAVSPPDQALGVPTNALLEVVFSEPVASSTITASSIALKKGTSAVAGTLSLRLPHVATFQPTTALSAGLYTASITIAVKDPAGNPLAEPVSFSFTVGTSSQLLPLQLAVQSPAPGQVAVATNRLVVATFSQQVAPSTVTTSTFTVSANGAPLAGTIALSGPDVVFLPGAPLPASTTVSVAASTELADLAGNHLAAPLSWSFTTGAGPDTTPPSISARSPADGASDVPVGAPIVLTFTEPLLPATVGPAALTLADGLGVAVAGALSLAGDTLSFQPSQPLSYRTSYVATFHHGPTDLAGNPSTADATISFTTAGLPGAHVVEVGAKVAAGALGDTNGDGARDVSDDEFVELLNTDAVPVDLSSWVLRTGSSSSTLVTRFTFPVGAQLAPGARAVVFGGGAPTGDFGGALVYAATSSLSLLDGGAWIELQEAGGLDADPPFLYPAAPTTGASLQRDPEVGGPFVAHTGPAGSTGVLWSPGTSPTGTRLKVNRLLSVPGSGAIGVDPTAPITLQLNTKLLFESVAGNTHLFASSCASSTGEVAGAATTTNAGTAILFTPAAPLAASALHCIRAGSGLRTDARDAGGTPVGRTLGAADSWEFTTFPPVDATAPTVLALRPLDGATAVPSSTRIEVTFDEAIDPTTVTTSTITLTSAGGSVAGDLQFFPPASATFTPFGPLVEGEVYTATIATGVKDLAGNPLALPVTSVFTVATSTAPVPLQFLAVSPGAGAANVARNQSIVVAFDRAVASSTVDAGSFIVTASGTPVAGILSVSTTEVTFSPLALYPTSTTISLLLTTAIQDLAGNGLESSVVSSFTTTSGPPPFGVTLAVLAAPLQLTVLFSDPPDPVTGAVAGNYCIAAGSAVACSPSLLNVASATTTGSTATLTLGTVATPGATYRIFVAAVLRAADGAPLTAGSALFTAPAAPPFTLAAATSTFDTEIAVAFSQPPLDGAGAGAFCIAFTSSSDCSSPALAVAAVATSTAGSNVLLLTTTGQVKGLPYRVYAPGVVRASDGQACTSTIDLKGALLANGSFEADATSTTPTTAPPARWTMLTGAASGRLHARRADELTSLTSTAHGANVAWFDSLTASVGGREARSECFPLDATKPLTVRGATAVPAADAPAGTRASFKVWYFTDDLCSASSTTRAFDTQNSAANAAAGVWESRTYPVAAPPADAHSAWISLRALYAAPGTATSTIFFDALSVTQP